jgi:hypothetical protein
LEDTSLSINTEILNKSNAIRKYVPYVSFITFAILYYGKAQENTYLTLLSNSLTGFLCNKYSILNTELLIRHAFLCAGSDESAAST